MTSAPAIGFEYRPSAWPRRVRLSVGALALVAVLVSGLGFWLKTSAVVVVLLSQLLTGRYVEASPVAVGWSADAGWTLRTHSGIDQSAELKSWRVVGAGIVLNLVYGSVKQTLWLLPDNCDADTRRRLRMRLATLPSSSGA